jgi:hypothetical protein
VPDFRPGPITEPSRPTGPRHRAPSTKIAESPVGEQSAKIAGPLYNI